MVFQIKNLLIFIVYINSLKSFDNNKIYSLIFYLKNNINMKFKMIN